MRTTTRLALLRSAISLVFALSASSADAAKLGDQIPAPVLEGLEAYAKNGFVAAIDVWVKNSVLDGNAAAKGQLLQITEIERHYGKYEGHQLTRVSMLTPRVQRVYIAIYYEKSPLWAYFDVYERKGGELIISEMLFNTKAAQILPGDFFYK